MREKLRGYSTPSMVLNIEHLCKKVLDEHLDNSESSVRTHVEINHLDMTLINMCLTSKLFLRK